MKFLKNKTYCFDIQALCSNANSAIPILLLKKSICFLNCAMASNGVLCWNDNLQIWRKQEIYLLYLQGFKTKPEYSKCNIHVYVYTKTSLALPHFCACLRTGTKFTRPYAGIKINFYRLVANWATRKTK